MIALSLISTETVYVSTRLVSDSALSVIRECKRSVCSTRICRCFVCCVIKCFLGSSCVSSLLCALVAFLYAPKNAQQVLKIAWCCLIYLWLCPKHKSVWQFLKRYTHLGGRSLVRVKYLFDVEWVTLSTISMAGGTLALISIIYIVCSHPTLGIDLNFVTSTNMICNGLQV